MKKLTIIIHLLLLVTYAKAEWYNISELGADNKGKKLCTDIVNNSITKAAANGGGTIYFPAGKYLTGPIHLKSNITLYLEAGAQIKFSDDFDDYLPFVKVRYEGIFMNTFSPLIYADRAENIAIKGEGEIDGNGFEWWRAIKEITNEVKQNGKVTNPDKYQQKWSSENKDLDSMSFSKNKFFRPPFIQFIECKKVSIEGITIKNSPLWTINPVGCEDVLVHGVTIFNPSKNPHGWNTDGINPSSCSNVRISDCFISVGDDCVTIKSGKNKFGRDYGRPSQNITITNCVMLSGHGGVVIGSEMSGGVKDVTISNCVFNGTDNGIRLKSSRGRGGVVENIRVDNITMRDIKGNAFIFNLFYDKKSKIEPVSERTPVFRNIHISNITGIGINKTGFITGIEEMPVDNVTFENINITAIQGFFVKTATNLRFNNFDVSAQEGPSLSFANCKNIVLDDVRSETPQHNQAVVEIASSESVFIKNCSQMVPTPLFSKIIDSKVIWGHNIWNLVELKEIGNNKSIQE
jgi:polygalacturonase